jgi:hypothetical protein
LVVACLVVEYRRCVSEVLHEGHKNKDLHRINLYINIKVNIYILFC